MAASLHADDINESVADGAAHPRGVNEIQRARLSAARHFSDRPKIINH
jgi:hypothetical protein